MAPCPRWWHWTSISYCRPGLSNKVHDYLTSKLTSSTTVLTLLPCWGHHAYTQGSCLKSMLFQLPPQAFLKLAKKNDDYHVHLPSRDLYLMPTHLYRLTVPAHTPEHTILSTKTIHSSLLAHGCGMERNKRPATQALPTTNRAPWCWTRNSILLWPQASYTSTKGLCFTCEMRDRKFLPSSCHYLSWAYQSLQRQDAF